ncbi:MAG: HAD hydrolase family protein, partial [Anaerolineaceae bacterium]|nr:HAD hydrolase family protein [Anaerolineaceae bacterium]
RVFVDGEGHEFVAAYRSDSLGVQRMMAAGYKAIVLSTETDPVVAARCKKMKIPYIQSVGDKASVLLRYLNENSIDPQHVVFLGNDINDLPCFPLVGCGVAVADAQLEVMAQADLVLSRPGGYGAVRELCDRILQS